MPRSLRTLGIDLASARWSSNGSALVEFDLGTPADATSRANAASRVDVASPVDDASGAFTRVAPGAITWPSDRDVPLTPQAIAAAIHAFVVREDVRAVALDGPQAWRNPDTPAHLPGVGRRCEYACRTQGKTGVYPKAYPGTQFGWIDFCVQVFDALLAQPGVRLAHAAAAVADGRGGYVVLECFPTAIWRASGLTPLPAKSKRPDVQRFYDALASAYALPPAQVTNHDDLQAVVAALAAVGAVGGPVVSRRHGERSGATTHADGARRVEGFIWDAAPLASRSPVHRRC